MCPQVLAYLGRVGVRDSLTSLPEAGCTAPLLLGTPNSACPKWTSFYLSLRTPSPEPGSVPRFSLLPYSPSPALTESVHQNLDHNRSNPFAPLNFTSFCPEATMSRWPMGQPLIGPPAAILSLSPRGSQNTNPFCHCPAETPLRGAP